MDSETLEGLCPVCGAQRARPILDLAGVPVFCNVLWAGREEALSAPRGDIRLGYCQACGHLHNLAFNPEALQYAQTYENSLHFSPRFQEYATALAERLIARYGLRGKDIIEIGSGKGDFLKLLCALGDNRGVGFDPSYVPDVEATGDGDGRVQFIQDLYSERYAGYDADLICSRHTLEHVPQPAELLRTVRRAIGDRRDTVTFFEVPNTSFMLERLGVWDIIYEHYSYFSPSSLSYLFAANGFRVVEVAEAFGGQYLTIDALPARDGEHPPSPLDAGSPLHQRAASFGEGCKRKVASWQQRLAKVQRLGQRVAAWGAGSKGVMFLNLVASAEAIGCVVDINPRKQGRYVAGTGHHIVAPEFLREYRPDLVVAMNPIYASEIRQWLQELGVTAELVFA